jgi:hypothetical protein
MTVPQEPSDLVQGTLEMLILRVLALEPLHGYGIGVRLEQISRGTFRIKRRFTVSRVSAAGARWAGDGRVAAHRERTAREVLHADLAGTGQTQADHPGLGASNHGDLAHPEVVAGRVVMAWIHNMLGGIRALVRRQRADQELDDELRAFLDASVEHKVASGMRPEDAIRAARLELGSEASVKDAVRDVGWESWMDGIWRDITYARRSFTRSPGFTVVAVLTLAVGVGANTAIFSVVHGVLLKPLPYTDSERIVRLYMNMPASESPSKRPLRAARGLTAHQLEEVRTKVRAFSHVGTASGLLRGLPSIEEAARLQGVGASASVFEMIGARSALGRVFTPQDEAPASPPVIILSHTAWQRYFGGDPNIVGTELAMDSVLGSRVEYRYTVIGVMPPDFAYPDRETLFWLPFRTATPTGAPQSGPLVARLADGVSVEAALAELTPLLQALRPEAPETRYELAFDQRELVEPIRPALLLLMGAVGFVLLIACVNVANLLLARSAARQREMAVRVAIGAGRGRLIRQMLTESLLLAALGGIVGTVLAIAGVNGLKTLATTMTRIDVSPGGFPRVERRPKWIR